MDPVLVKLLAFAAVFLISLPFVHRQLKDAQDPEWEERWGELPHPERERISAAVRRGERFEDPNEAYLAAGSAREQRVFGGSHSHSHALRLVIAGVLLLAAVAEGSLLMVVLALALLALFGWFARRDRVTKRNLEQAEAGNREY
ncbi:MAG TPA: hypothetical protein VF030_00685 [Solirubrobacterales bacterium]